MSLGRPWADDSAPRQSTRSNRQRVMDGHAAKTAAVTMAGGGSIGNRVHSAIEIAGAGFVLVLGLLLLAASLGS